MQIGNKEVDYERFREFWSTQKTLYERQNSTK